MQPFVFGFPFERLDEVQLQCMRTSELYRIHGAGVTYSEIICGRMVIALLDVDDRHCQITFFPNSDKLGVLHG